MEDQFILLENDNVTIVNRKKSYEISKQKLSSIPYFVKLFSDPNNCDLAEIKLDLDESSFDNIVDFVLNNHLSISMECAFSMMEIADYLGMEDIKQKYYDCFVSNFNIKRLEEFLDFYENRKYPENFTENKVKSFIGKYFVPISNTRAFLKFPVALIERILKMNLVVSYEYQIVEAIERWVKSNEKDRKKYLPQLIKFVNFCHLTEREMKKVVNKVKYYGVTFDTPQLKDHSHHACQLEFCQSDCKSNRHSTKSLVSIYELGEDNIEIRRLSRANIWTKSYRFTRDETMSTSLIEADHIVDIIYDSGRKGIRIDWNTEKFKYLKMFGGDDSYYGQAYKYFAHDICTDSTYVKIKNPPTEFNHKRSNITHVEAISLDEKFEGICYRNNNHDDFDEFDDSYFDDLLDKRRNHRSSESDECDNFIKKSQKQYYLPSLDYRELSSGELKGSAQALSCLSSNPNSESNYHKVLYYLTKRDFSRYLLRDDKSKVYALDYSFLKDFIGSDSLDHIELISHNNSILICNKESKIIYSYVVDSDHWQFMSKIESPEKMIAIASVFFPIGLE
ncbi:uncharacterized protein LOC128387157 [Panonychus citri]|uniref:uncharacterized protein LOC128387157 n=1 Tax=Panonychus citri TaxID=50023 RepID=UPI0023080FF3|nr:uncharacterized protein LOC128387157 [Panonychus citri]